jgi:hypothetical protein
MKFFNQKQLAISMLIMSALPFPALVIMHVTGQQAMGLSPAVLLHVYTAVLVAFILGMQWSIHFCKRTEDSVYLFTTLLLILMLYSLFSLGQTAGLVMALLGVTLSWLIEFRLSRQRVTTVWYWQSRCLVSLIAFASVLLVILV